MYDRDRRALPTSIVFTVAGVAGLGMILAGTGFKPVLGGIGAVGWTGFGLLILGQLVLMIPLALAGRSVCPGASLRLMLRARLVREAITNCLPFTSLGGIAFGMRVLTASRAIGWPLATVAIAADVTMELVGQIVFVLIGLGLLLLRHADLALALGCAGAAAVAAFAVAAALLTQRRSPQLLSRLVAIIGVPGLQGAGAAVVTLEEMVQRVHGRPSRLAVAASFHLLGWIGGAGLTWLSFRLLDVPIEFGSALIIESVLSFARLIAFFVPNGIGVQEAVYVALGGIFGVSASTSLSVSLLRRGRELAVGIAVLLVWPVTDLRLVLRDRPLGEVVRR